MSQVQTNSGEMVSLINPDEATIQISDITQGLMQPRFNNQLNTPVSILHHSLMVYQAAFKWGYNSDVRLAALLHDAPEAYVGDVSRPVKELLGDQLRAIEDRLFHAIYSRIRKPYPEPGVLTSVSRLDKIFEYTDAVSGFSTIMLWVHEIASWAESEELDLAQEIWHYIQRLSYQQAETSFYAALMEEL